MRLKLSRQIPRRATGRPTGQINECGPADLALHNLLAILHRETERHQVSIIPNSLTSRQRHEPPSLSWSVGADRDVVPPALRLVLLGARASNGHVGIVPMVECPLWVIRVAFTARNSLPV
jgi:hypothetical protein